MRICIDAGHGGSDPGAVGNALREKDCTLSMAEKLKKQLLAAGAEVILTRERDEYVSLSKRCAITNAAEADLFISIHVNSAASSSANGIETLCFSASGESGTWAKRVQNALVAASGWRDRGVKERRDLAVLRGTDMCAILMEVGFISNPEERAKIALEEVQEKLMEAAAKAILGTGDTKEEEKKVYQTIDEVPEWGKETVIYLVERGALSGNGEGLALSEEMLRVFVVLDRLNVLKNE